ncbi:MAG: TRAP transporter substrate-binding protein [Syntrophobacterales bacterium]|jgi:TRAP-type C4-dicarboxylate transport system substrate-binding protein|nr:TRAP transporter substrate-binding protein [Syntrophobacterales bacterium]
MGRKVTALLFAIALVLSVSSMAGADVIKLKFANYFPPTHMNSVMMGKYCEEINKKLAGKAEVTQYTGGTLLTATKMAAGVSSGIADIGLSHLSYSRGRFPVMEIMELPLGFPSSWIATHVGMDFYEKVKPKEWDAYHPLMFSTSPPNVIQTLKKPVKTLDELKGLKIRGSGRIGDIVKALGAIPMPIETVDLYEALRRGVVDGTYTPLETLKGFKLGEVEKYSSATWKVGSVFQFYVVFNKRKWDSLPPDVKDIFTEFSKEFVERWAVEWNKIDFEGKEYFMKLGGQIVPVSDAEQAKMVKAVEPVVSDYKKDLIAKGFKAAEVDGWVNFVKERIEYWKGQEKEQKVPTVYSY